MLVVSAGLPKSGSALCFNLINELLVLNGYSNIRDIRDEYDLNDTVIADDCFVASLSKETLLKLFQPLKDGKSFVIKTHKFPTSDFFEFLRDNQVPFDIKFVYTYRDPRDVLISALDHHKKDPSSFNNFDSFENALILVNEHLKESLKWLDYDVHKLLFKYEVFSNDIVDTLYKLVDFLGLCDDLNNLTFAR